MTYHNTARADTESKTIYLKMGRHRFNGFLRELLGSPDGNDWGNPNLVIIDDNFLELAKLGVRMQGDVDYIEVFTDTLVAPLLAFHLPFPDESVIVAIPKPTKGIYRVVDELIAEMQDDAA